MFISFARCQPLSHALVNRKDRVEGRRASDFSSIRLCRPIGDKEVWHGCPALPQPGDCVGKGLHPLSPTPSYSACRGERTSGCLLDKVSLLP